MARLAQQFSSADLARAAILSLNPQDFTGQPLPSGASVSSHALSSATGASILFRDQEWDLIPPDHLAGALDADERLRSRLPEVGLAALHNDGLGVNACVIISMLQAAGVPPEQVVPAASALHNQLAGRPDALGMALQAGQGLYANPQVFRPLAEYIFGANSVPPILIMTPGPGGMPVLYDPFRGPADDEVNPATVPDNAVVLLESPGHFQQVANNINGRPWSIVLGQLQMMASGAPQNLPGAASIQDGARAVLPMNTTIVDAAGRVQTHRWARGLQTRLTRLDDKPTPEPLMQARAMAEARETVNDFLAALGRWASFDLGQTPSEGGGRVHRLGLSPMRRPEDEDQVEGEDGEKKKGYHETLKRNDRGEVFLTGARGDDTGAFQYIGELTVRQGRVTHLTLHSTGEGDIAVEFDNPWSRPGSGRFGISTPASGPVAVRRALDPQLARPTRQPPINTRAALTVAEQSLYDRFAAPARAGGYSHDQSRFAALLRNLRQNGLDWESFRRWPDEQRSAYLHKEVRQNKLADNVPAVAQRAILIFLQRPAPAPSRTDAEQSPYDRFAAHARARRRQDPSRFAALLRNLQQNHLDWESFRRWPDRQRDEYLRNEVRQNRLADNVPAVARRAIRFFAEPPAPALSGSQEVRGEHTPQTSPSGTDFHLDPQALHQALEKAAVQPSGSRQDPGDLSWVRTPRGEDVSEEGKAEILRRSKLQGPEKTNRAISEALKVSKNLVQEVIAASRPKAPPQGMKTPNGRHVSEEGRAEILRRRELNPPQSMATIAHELEFSHSTIQNVVDAAKGKKKRGDGEQASAAAQSAQGAGGAQQGAPRRRWPDWDPVQNWNRVQQLSWEPGDRFTLIDHGVPEYQGSPAYFEVLRRREPGASLVKDDFRAVFRPG